MVNQIRLKLQEDLPSYLAFSQQLTDVWSIKLHSLVLEMDSLCNLPNVKLISLSVKTRHRVMYTGHLHNKPQEDGNKVIFAMEKTDAAEGG